MNSLSFQKKLFVIIASVNILIITAIAIIIYVSNVNEMKKQTESLSDILSNQFSRTIDFYFENVETLSLAIFTDSYIQDNLSMMREHLNPYEEFAIRNNIYNRLFNHTYPHQDIERISIYTRGDIVYDYARQGDVNIRYETGETDWEQRLETMDKSDILLLNTSEASLSHETVQVVSLVRNIYNIPQREKIGALKIDVNVEAFSRLLEISGVNELEDYIHLFIMSDDQEIIFDYDQVFTGTVIENLNLPDTGDESATGEIGWGEDNYLFTSNVSAQTDWNTVILINDDFIVYERNQILFFIFTIVLVALFLNALVSYFLSAHISKPLNKLMQKMQRVEQGDLKGKMKLTGNVEMDVLTRVYNNMLESINQLIKEVYESKIAEKNAKISALQSQINPHFLYNTLNIMKSIGRIRKVDEVSEISESLSDLFKYSMQGLDKPVPLKYELEHIHNYITIQMHRFKNRFAYETDIQINSEDVSVPKLSVQPVIENAINHGLAHVKQRGLISLTVFAKEDTLFVEVRDNGKGVSNEGLKQLKHDLEHSSRQKDESSGGIGLINIQQRIQLIYGEEYGVEINNNRVEPGTTVTLKMPLTESLRRGGKP